MSIKSYNISMSSYGNKYDNFKKRLLKKIGGATCFYCSSYLNKEEITLDHKIPLSKGGDLTDQDNIILCCQSCNQLKSNLSFEEFMEKKGELFLQKQKEKEMYENPFNYFFTGKPILDKDICEYSSDHPIHKDLLIVFDSYKVHCYHSSLASPEQIYQNKILIRKIVDKSKNHSSQKISFVIKDGEAYIKRKKKLILVNTF